MTIHILPTEIPTVPPGLQYDSTVLLQIYPLRRWQWLQGGLPEEVIASTDNARWYTTIFDYRIRSVPHERFTCVYETGIVSVPRFDSHVTVYGEDKSVSVCYDTPFVEGLGISAEIDEMNEHGGKVHRSIQTSYEDAYPAELKELYACVVGGKPIKTTAAGVVEDLKFFDMILKKYPQNKKGKADGTSSSDFLPSGGFTDII